MLTNPEQFGASYKKKASNLCFEQYTLYVCVSQKCDCFGLPKGINVSSKKVKIITPYDRESLNLFDMIS